MKDGTRLVYVCEGGDCSERGSIELHNELKCRLEARDKDGKNRLRKYPCFGGCEQGVNVVLFPDKVFFSEVKESDIEALTDHLVGEGPSLDHLKGKVEQDVEDITWELLDVGF
jgi:NADH:ubiquinone oxidoreductase subunit E